MQAPPGHPVGRDAPTSWVIAPSLGQLPTCHSPLLGVGAAYTSLGLGVGAPHEGGKSSGLYPTVWQRVCNISQASEQRGEPEALSYFICGSLSAAPTASKSTEAHTGH